MEKERRKVQFSWPDITEEEINEVVETLRGGWITTGPRTKQFEREIAEFTGTESAVCLNSATAAEELNLRMLGIGPGDEVIVPAFTYTATVSSALHVGATVVPIDCQDGCQEMDYDAVERAVTEKTKAIIPADLYGLMSDYDRLFEIADRKKDLFRPKGKIQEIMGRIAIVSDAAHSLGATRNGKRSGQAADFSSFSFHAVKNITSAEGGASVWKHIEGIDDEEIYHQFMLYSLHGQNKDAYSKNNGGGWEYDILGPWYKCNMTDILAAVGMIQLRRYPGFLARRKDIIEQYDKLCDEMGIQRLVHYGEDHAGSGHLYITRTPWLDESKRNEVIKRMKERAIDCNVHYKPLPMMTAYKALGWKIEDFPNAFSFYRNLITLPLHTLLSDDDVAYVVDCFREIVGEYH